MLTTILDTYIATLRSDRPVTPILIDEDGAISLLASIFGEEILGFHEYKTGDFPGVFFYGVAEEKQHFDILTVRRCIADMSLEPYSGKNIAVLRDFHTATLEAQNAILKLLEDCPSYSAIILVVADVESLLDTIRSRTISLFYSRDSFTLDAQVRQYMNDFLVGRVDDLVRYLFDAKYTKEEAIAILRYGIFSGNGDSRFVEGIENLFSTNESPRNILDSILLIPERV